MMHPSHSFQRIPSPTPAGTQPKRTHFPTGMEEEPEVETIQKLRRLTSPVSHTQNNINYVQIPSPKSQKASPKMGETQHRRSTSPKLFPPPIQKFLNGKGPTTAADALRKLKVPSKKNHRENLEKMHLLGLIQSHEVESSLLFRRSVSPSASSYYSSSPITSPRMEVSPRDYTPMPYDGAIGMQTSPQMIPMDVNLDKTINTNNCEPEEWKNNYMHTQNTPSGMASSVSTMASQNNTFGNSVPQESYQQPSYFQRNTVGYPNHHQNHHNGASFQQNSEQQMQYGQQQMINQPGPCVNSWNQGERQNHFLTTPNNNGHHSRPEQEGRDRTTSFLGNQGVPFDLSQFQFQSQPRPADNLSAVKSKAADQLAAIHQLMQDKKNLSASDSGKDMMQHFRKRNSNPEITMRSPEPQPLFPQGVRYRNSLEMDPYFINNNHTFTPNDNKEQFMFQTLPQQINNNNIQIQAKEDLPLEVNNNPHQLGMTQHQEQSNIYQKESTTNTSNQEVFGYFSNEQNHQSSSQGHYSGNVSEEFIDPDAFLNAGNPPESEEFDMNITHTALSFMPQNDIFGEIEPHVMFPKFHGPGEFPDDDIGI